MAAFGQATWGYFEQDQLWGRLDISDSRGNNFSLSTFLCSASFPSDSSVSLSFHLNWGGNKYIKSLLCGRNSASCECQLLCLSLFQLAQLWAAEQPVWMTRGGILSSDITRCACGRKSDVVLVPALQWTVWYWLQVQKRCSENVASPELSGACLWNCQQERGHIFVSSAAFVGVVLAWTPDVGRQGAHSSLSARSSFPQTSTKEQKQELDCISLQIWPWHLSPFAAANSQGDMRKLARPVHMLIGELCSFLATVFP